MDATFLRWGLTISTKKTKVLVVGRNAAAQAADSVIMLRGDQLDSRSHLVALGLVSMMLLCMIAKPVGLVDRIEMRKTDCFGKTRLVPHVPSSS